MLPSMNLIQIIKKAAIEAVEASNPAKVLYGTVVNSTPAVKIDQKFAITKEFIVETERMKEMNLAAGDKVVLLQEQGGQRYIILDKVGG